MYVKNTASLVRGFFSCFSHQLYFTRILEAKQNTVLSRDIFDLLLRLFQPCPDDSVDTNSLIKQRASETCRRMLTNGALNSTVYTAVGSAYNSHGRLVNILSNIFLSIMEMVVLYLVLEVIEKGNLLKRLGTFAISIMNKVF